jgi:hypothetical protein
MTLLILWRADLLRALKDDAELSMRMMVELAKMFRRLSSSNTE